MVFFIKATMLFQTVPRLILMCRLWLDIYAKLNTVMKLIELATSQLLFQQSKHEIFEWKSA